MKESEVQQRVRIHSIHYTVVRLFLGVCVKYTEHVLVPRLISFGMRDAHCENHGKVMLAIQKATMTRSSKRVHRGSRNKYERMRRGSTWKGDCAILGRR